jgi:putative addiction module component (TIGR02574 family)
MSPLISRLKAEIDQLPVQDRAELAHYLIRSLDEQEDADSEAAWDAELTRRAADIRSGRAKGKPADQVLSELREKYS